MPFIENTFNLAIPNLSNKTAYSISNLLGDGKDVQVTTNCLEETSLLLAKAVYRTLLDAGYSATLNENTYMITVLGFPFFVLAARTPYTSGDAVTIRIFTYGLSKSISDTTPLNDYGELTTNFMLRLRGDENGFALTCVPYTKLSDPTEKNESYVLCLCRGTNLVQKETAWLFDNSLTTADTYTNGTPMANKDYVTTYSDIYTATPSAMLTKIGSQYQAANTDTRCTYRPVFAHHNTLYLPSLICGNKDIFEDYGCYKIGDEIFWKVGTAEVMMRIS